MYICNCLSTNDAGHLTIGNLDTVELAKQYGTPLYVMDEDTIRGTLRAFKSSIDRFYDGNGDVAYASKAFSCKEMYRIVQQENCCTDVVSIGELHTALSAGFPAEKALFHGSNKTAADLVYAVDKGVGHIVVDNITELSLLAQIAESQQKVVAILFRIKPGVSAHTHEAVQTGQVDSKFGFGLETGEAMAAVRQALGCKWLKLAGIHCHIGSQIFDAEPFELAAKVMLGFMLEVRRETGYLMTTLNLGGGFGIAYVPENDPVDTARYMELVSGIVHRICEQENFPLPRVIIEPGRSVVGPAGITLYTVGAVKNIPNVRTYVSVDGGMNDNPRYILYKSEYEAIVANRATKPKDTVVTLAGRCCESGDLLGEHMPLQSAGVGDIIAVLATGAYNYAMASNYNRNPRAAVVMVRDGQSRLIVKRESLEDVCKNDL